MFWNRKEDIEGWVASNGGDNWKEEYMVAASQLEKKSAETVEIAGYLAIPFRDLDRYKYEFNVKYSAEDYWVSLSMKHALTYFEPHVVKIFRVRSIVDKKKYEEYCSQNATENRRTYSHSSINSMKMEQLEILSEISQEEYLELFVARGFDFKSFEDVERMRNGDAYSSIIMDREKHRLSNIGFSDIFITLIQKKCFNRNIEETIILAEALAKEGVSKDMQVYLLFEHLAKKEKDDESY